MNAQGPVRIALYSPGIVGLGHLRRNLLISQVLAESSLSSVNLMVTEAREASMFLDAMPAGVDCITLPGLSKGVDGVCRPRYLNLPLKQLITLRGRTIRTALLEFQPDLLIVDNLPRGAYRELDPALRQIKSAGKTHCVLGLRDVLDEPWSVYRDWLRWRFDQAIEQYFDAIWVYGDPSVFNMIDEYKFPSSIAKKIRFAGYLDQRRRLTPQTRLNPETEEVLAESRKLILCLLGGGQDGERLADAFVNCALPADSIGVLVTGPFMSPAVRAELEQKTRDKPQLRLLQFIPEPTALVHRAERIIAMGGYNTVCEVLSFQKPALIVPRVKPRREQIIRAERLRALGLIDMLEPDQLDSRALSEWLKRDIAGVQHRLDFGGLDRLPAMAAEVLQIPFPQPVSSHSKVHEVDTTVALS